MWLLSSEQPSDWYSPHQLGLARIGLGLLIVVYLGLWPELQPAAAGSLPLGAEQHVVQLPRLGRGLVRLGALLAGLMLIVGWARWPSALAAAGLSALSGLMGRADPAVATTLCVGTLLLASSGSTGAFGLPPIAKQTPADFSPPQWWSRSLWLAVGVPLAVLLLTTINDLTTIHEGATAWTTWIAVALIASMVWHALSGTGPSAALIFFPLLGMSLVGAAGIQAVPVALWAILTSVRVNTLAPLRMASSHFAASDPASPDEESLIVFYDGVCGFCHRSVQFLLIEDRRRALSFAPLQGQTAARLANAHPALGQDFTRVSAQENGRAEVGTKPLAVADIPGSLALLDSGQCFVRSDGALRIARHLGGFWSVVGWARVLPRGLRDAVYDLIASRRYQLFGRFESCRIPTHDEKARLLS